MQHARYALPAHVHAEPDLGHPQMGITGHDAEVQGDRQRDAAADAKTFDGAIVICSCPARPASAAARVFKCRRRGPRSMFLRARPSGSLRSKPALNALAERSAPRRGRGIVLKAAGGIGELAHRLRRQRIDAVAAVKADDRDAALGPEAFFDGDKAGQGGGSLPVIFGDRSSQMSRTLARGPTFRRRKADRGAECDQLAFRL